ncbi:MAG: GAF domain-containing protein [Blastochloris sp.]|nr:GAF domain-containing protein [Blastochloris sp.]
MTNILIVCESTNQRTSTSHILQSGGYDVVEAANTSEGLTCAEQDHPELIVLDARSSDVDSDAFIHTLRATQPTSAVPILMLHEDCAQPMHGTRTNGTSLNGAPDALLCTPIQEQDLLVCVQTMLRMRETQITLYHQNQRLKAQLELLTIANRSLDLRVLSEQLLDCLLWMVGLSYGGIWLYDRDQIVCLAQRGLNAEQTGGSARRRVQADSPFAQSLHSGKAIYYDMVASVGASSIADEPQPLAIIPLMLESESIGVLQLSTIDGSSPATEDYQLLDTLLVHIARAIHRAYQYEWSERQRHRLEIVDRKKDEYISIISHELKNPMASIKGYADLVLRRIRKNPDDPNRKGLEIISQQVKRMTGLLEQLIDFSRINMNRLKLNLEQCDIGDITKRVVEDLHATTTQHQLTLTIRDTPLIAPLDEPRITQAISNIIGNAIKYSPADGSITIHIKQHQTDPREALLSISDQGVGIPEAEQDKLFQRFFRASNVEEDVTGTGLGLFITREIVSRHGGRIWFESHEGQGTTFFITLPLVSVIEQPDL